MHGHRSSISACISMTVEMVEEVHNPSFDSFKKQNGKNDPVSAAIAEIDVEQLAFVVARLKASGNEAFQAKRYRGKCFVAQMKMSS